MLGVDSFFANKAFVDQNGVTFPLFSDFGGKVAADYGNSFLINDLNFRKSRFRSLNIRLPAAVILLEARLKAESSSRNARTGDR